MITLLRESPVQPDLDLLHARHTADMHAQTPPESIHMLPADALVSPDIDFFVLRKDGHAVGMGAFKRIDATHAEIKSMHILTEHRGGGLARLMLETLINEARLMGYARLSLETGVEPIFAPARGLYERLGFTYCDPFEGYAPDPNSCFMTRAL